MDILEIVKAKLPDPKPADVLLEMDIEEVGQSIKIYCNRTDIPKELRFAHANMVVDFINGNNRRSDPEQQSAVASIREGDTTVQYGAAKVDSRERATEQLLFDYAKQLNKFRKLRW